MKYQAIDVEMVISEYLDNVMLKIASERDADKIIIYESNFLMLIKLKNDVLNLRQL